MKISMIPSFNKQEMFYDEAEAEKCTKNTRIIEIQAAMKKRTQNITASCKNWFEFVLLY